MNGGWDYYSILGVAPTATPEEIAGAYRRLDLVLHPGHGGPNPDLFRLVGAARDTLRKSLA